MCPIKLGPERVSFEAVFEAFNRTREHIARQQTKVAYGFVTSALERARDLFWKWLDIYQLYAKGYQAEVATWSKPFIARELSLCGRGLERKLPSIFQPKIPPEVYIILYDLFGSLSHSSDSFILAEEDGFEQKSFYDEIYMQSLKNLSPPRKVSAEEDKRLKEDIQKQDLAILYYERGQHDNALSWPLLLHEALHWLYNAVGLGALEEKIRDKPSWINEVLIDIYVSSFFGPAYATALVSYLSRYPHEETLSHPHFIVRLYTCYSYLVNLVASRKLPAPLGKEVQEALEYIGTFQAPFEDMLQDIKEPLKGIFEKTNEAILENISSKTKPFAALMQDLEQTKKGVKFLSPKEYSKKEVFLTTDVQEYYSLGIPVAAEPRVLFNSFIAKNYIDKSINTLFVQESLKKYYVRKKWSSMAQT